MSNHIGIDKQTINIYCNLGYGEQLIGTANTNLDRSYSTTWSAPDNLPQGFYLIHSVFSGTDLYEPSECFTQNGPDGGGLMVVPEYWLGTLAPLLVCFAVLLGIKIKKANNTQSSK